MSHEFIISLGLIIMSSLSGSFHCAGMCGAFSCLVCKKNAQILSITGYHVGRLLTYLALSILMYSSTSLLQIITRSQSAIYLSLGVCIILLIIDLLKDLRGKKSTSQYVILKNSITIPKSYTEFLSRFISRYITSLTIEQSPKKSLLLGLITGLLPCGWLYVYIVLAGTQPNIWYVALSIMAFWLGTIPALLTSGFLGARITDSIFPKIKYISRCLLIVAALISIHFRFPFLTSQANQDCNFCISEGLR